MSNAAHKVKELVALAKGNRSQAERLIRETIARDPVFLRQLVEPFLPGIIAHALSRIVEQRPGAAPTPLPESGMDALMRGLQNTASSAPARPAGDHADTIRALAEAQRQRRDGK